VKAYFKKIMEESKSKEVSDKEKYKNNKR